MISVVWLDGVLMKVPRTCAPLFSRVRNSFGEGLLSAIISSSLFAWRSSIWVDMIAPEDKCRGTKGATSCMDDCRAFRSARHAAMSAWQGRRFTQ
jgi:hypothetical protein